MNRLMIDHKVLKSFCSKNKWSYKELAANSGLSPTQAFHLLNWSGGTKKASGGATSIGCLLTLGVPGLFFLEQNSNSETKKIPVEIIVREAL